MNAVRDLKDDRDLEKLRVAVKSLRDHMLPHLAEEEVFTSKALKEYFTEKEEMVVVDKILKSLGLKGNKLTLPWMLDVMAMWRGRKDT